MAVGVGSFEVAGGAAFVDVGGEVTGEAEGVAVEVDVREVEGGEVRESAISGLIGWDGAFEVCDVAIGVEKGETMRPLVNAGGVGKALEVDSMRGQTVAEAGLDGRREVEDGTIETAGNVGRHVESASGEWFSIEGEHSEGLRQRVVGGAVDAQVGGEVDLLLDLLLVDTLADD